MLNEEIKEVIEDLGEGFNPQDVFQMSSEELEKTIKEMYFDEERT